MQSPQSYHVAISCLKMFSKYENFSKETKDVINAFYQIRNIPFQMDQYIDEIKNHLDENNTNRARFIMNNAFGFWKNVYTAISEQVNPECNIYGELVVIINKIVEAKVNYFSNIK